jgi:hypothetical protein
MTSAALKIKALEDDRTEEQRARAAPVPLPAGSYDARELQTRLDEAAKTKPDNRGEAVAKALADTNQTKYTPAGEATAPGYERRTVEDEVAGVVEERVVFNKKAGEAAAEAEAAPPDKPGAAAADTAGKGE